jgi:hypothetical protein
MEFIAFRSDHSDLDEVCCAQIDQIFPRGSQTRQSDGRIPLQRIATLGFHGLADAIRLTPLEIQRIAGEMDVLAEKEGVAREIAGRICAWLERRSVRVDGWPPPPTRFPAVNSFSAMSDRSKALSLIETIQDGHRAFYRQESEWLVKALKKLAE